MTWVEELELFHRQVAAAKPISVRAIGLRAMQAGTVILFAGLPISQIVMHIGLGFIACGLVLARPPVQRMPGFLWALACTIWMVAGPLTLKCTSSPSADFGTAAVSWLALYGVVIGCQSEALRRWALRTAAIALCAAAVLALLQFVIGHGDVRPFRIDADGKRFQRVGGFFGSGLTLGVVSVCLALVFRSPAIRAISGSAYTNVARVASLVTVVVSLSRMAWLGLATGIGVGITALTGRWRSALLACVGLLALGALCMQIAPFGRKVFRPDQDGRWIIWSISAGIAADHPMFGVGGGRSFQKIYAERWRDEDAKMHFRVREPTQPHAHNSLLVLASENGIPALVLYLGFLVSLLRGLHGTSRSDRQTWAMGISVLAAWFVAGQFNNLVGEGDRAYVFYACFGLALALAARPNPQAQR
jgi:O-antigen ligase